MNASATRLLNKILGFTQDTVRPMPERRKHKDMWRPAPDTFRGSHESQFANYRRTGAPTR